MSVFAVRSELDRNRLRYAFAHGTRSIAWSTVDLLLAWHLHVVVGLSGIEASGLLFGFLLVGSVAALLAGFWLSKVGAEAESYVRLQLVSGIVASGLLAFQFLGRDAMIVIATGIGFRIAFAILEVSQNALAALLPNDDTDTKTYARLHVMISSATRLLVLSAHVLLLRYQDVSIRSAIIICLALLTTFGSLGLRRVKFPATRPSPSTFSGRALDLGVRRLLLAFAASTVMMPTLTRLLIFLPDSPGITNVASWMVAAYYIGSTAGPFIHARLIATYRDRHIAALCVVVAAISSAVILLPLPTLIRGTAALAHGIALSMLVVGLWADAAITARRDGSDGLVFGSVAFTMYMSSAFGALVMGPLIEGIERGGVLAIGTAFLLTTIGAASIVVLRPRRKEASASA